MGSPRVVVGMSGGVDSSVTALLLKEQGFEVIGLFMKNWEETDASGVCSAEQDYADVERVCQHLGISYSAVSFSREYAERVFAQFVADYERGLTPNPDVLCNREIKFNVFAEQARALGAEYIATGHYARLEGGRLLKGLDPGKDQSYFLHAVAPAAFSQVLFPIGGIQKSEVRELALRAGLPTATKKDSTGICFIGERKFREFLGQYLPAKPGMVRLWNADHPLGIDGQVIGEHQGVAFYTLGQRKGIRIGGSGLPYFVVAKDARTNTLIVAPGQDHHALYAPVVLVDRLHWLVPEADRPSEQEVIHAKLRYRQTDQACRWIAGADGGGKLIFDQPQRAATPGQFAVLYRGEQCLGGGVILGAQA